MSFSAYTEKNQSIDSILNPQKWAKKWLSIQILMALNLLTFNNQSYADPCTDDDGDGVFECSSNSENIDASLNGTLNIDNTVEPATFNNITTEAGYSNFDSAAQATVTNSSDNVGAVSAITATGNNAVTINNTGGYMYMDRSAAIFDRNAWSNDLDGRLYNDKDGLGPVLAGYAAIVSTGANVSALTVSNAGYTAGSIFPFTGSNFILGNMTSSGDYDPNNFAAVIFSSSSLVALNGSNQSLNGSVVTYAIGTTTLNFDNAFANGDYYAVDRNPLLTAAQADNPALALAYSAADVGARNSVINLTNSAGLDGNIYLGSGSHAINNVGSDLSANIFIDQRDAEVVDVVGGIATTQTTIRGDRNFTLNVTPVDLGEAGVRGRFIGNILINDVVGAVNTVNIDSVEFTNQNFSANGLGLNTINLNCRQALSIFNIEGCRLGAVSDGNVIGFTDYNLTGTKFTLQNNVNVTNSINLNAGLVELTSLSTLTAPRVTVGQTATVELRQANQGVGGAVIDSPSNIIGNVENNGIIKLNSNTLNIDGNATMNAGSKLIVVVTPSLIGNLNNTGTAVFSADSTLVPQVNLSSFGTNINVRNGAVYTIANNVSGLPTVENVNSLLQWVASESAGNLIITANIGVADFLMPQISAAAKNAIDSVFSYTGDDNLFTGLQAQLIAQRDQNLIRAAERLHPETNDGTFRMVQGNTDKVFGILESRLTSHYLKSTPDYLQTSALGNMPIGDSNPTLGKGIWVQGFGDRSAQDGLQKLDGYTSSAAGFAGGIDTALDAAGNKHAGLAISYARGNVTNTGNTANNRADINSFMGSVYGSWAIDDWYINGMVGVGRNTYETFRRLFDNTATGKHDSWQFSSRVNVGMPILFSENLTFVPLASLDYSHIKESGYSENGRASTPLLDSTSRPDLPPQPVFVNGIAQFNEGQTPTNLKIDGRTFDSIRGGLGAKAIYTFQQTDWTAELELHGLYRHEFGDVSQDLTARFVAGGNGFLSPGVKPVRDDFIFGGSVRLTGDDENDQLTLLTSYDANIRKQYFGQAMTLNLRYDFDKAPAYQKAAKAKLAQMAAKKVNAQNVQATEKDIVAINQAMQSEPDLADDQIALDENQQAIDRTIKNWTAALSKKNLDVYFNSYAADFTAPDGSSRQQWERKRKAEISKENNPSINISYLTIEPKGNQAIAVFTQTMVADAQEASVRKIVGLENRNGRWLIVREDSMAIN